MQLEVGAISPCGDAIIGRFGHIFLLNGSNNLHDQYVQPTTALEKWLKIITTRASSCASMGVDFLQVVVPEKQSIMSDMYPLSKPNLTPTLLGINEIFSSSKFYINAYDLLACLYRYKGIDPYRHGDTHLTSHGYIELAAAVAGRYCRRTQIDLLSGVELEYTKLRGDLLTKFYGKYRREKVGIPCPYTQFFSGEVSCSKFIEHPRGKKSGVSAIYTNSCPRIAKKVLLFGNSMSERGLHPLGLTWWLARLFKKVEFTWSPNVSFDRIEADPPDILISQTVERFLPVPAKA